MEDLFIGYLLNALDERGTRTVEAHLQAHPDARQKLALLQQALAPLAADQEAPAPPPQLVERTLARVAEHICAAARPSTELPQGAAADRAADAFRRAFLVAPRRYHGGRLALDHGRRNHPGRSGTHAWTDVRGDDRRVQE